jgi:hypothetical protein
LWTGVALAASPRLNPINDGVISAAYQKVTGALRLVNGPSDVNPSEQYISWKTQDTAGGITPGFGAWEDKWFYNINMAPGNIYQAQTDGFVVAYAPAIEFRGMEGLTGRTSVIGEMTGRIKTYSSTTQYGDKLAINMPVKKGDYWCVIASQWRYDDGTYDAKVSWIPFGN